MSLLILGLIVFIGVHLVPVMTGLRRSLVQEIGENGVKMVVDSISLKRRDLAAGGPSITPGPVKNDLIAIVGGLVLWAAFAFYLHEWLFGVAPFG